MNEDAHDGFDLHFPTVPAFLGSARGFAFGKLRPDGTADCSDCDAKWTEFLKAEAARIHNTGK